MINICKPNDRVPKYMKHKLTELKEVGYSVIVGDFNTLFSIMDIKPKKMSKGN